MMVTGSVAASSAAAHKNHEQHAAAHQRTSGTGETRPGNSFSLRAGSETEGRKTMPPLPGDEAGGRAQMPAEAECERVGTVIARGPTGLWQPRTVYLTKFVLGIANKDTGNILDEVSLLCVLKVTSLRAKMEQGDEGHVVVQDEVDCCFDLYVDYRLNRASRPNSPTAATSINASQSASAAGDAGNSDKFDDVRLFCFRTLSRSEREGWEAAVENAVADAKAAEAAARPAPTMYVYMYVCTHMYVYMYVCTHIHSGLIDCLWRWRRWRGGEFRGKGGGLREGGKRGRESCVQTHILIFSRAHTLMFARDVEDTSSRRAPH
jgi:hypothetical protein